MWPKFPDIYLTVDETPGKTLTRKLTRPGIEPRPMMLPLDHRVVRSFVIMTKERIYIEGENAGYWYLLC